MINRLDLYLKNKREIKILSFQKDSSKNERIAELRKENEEIKKFIFSCDNDRVRKIMELKYLDGHSWYYIGIELGIDRSTAQRALKSYFNKNKIILDVNEAKGQA